MTYFWCFYFEQIINYKYRTPSVTTPVYYQANEFCRGRTIREDALIRSFGEREAYYSGGRSNQGSTVFWTYLSIIDVGVKSEISRGVSNSKIVLGKLRFAGIKGHLVAAQPALVANDSWCIDRWAPQVEVNIRGHADHVLLILSLDLAGFGSSLGRKGWVKDQLGSLENNFWICKKDLVFDPSESPYALKLLTYLQPIHIS